MAEEIPEERRRVSVQFHTDPNLPTLYATNFTVQHTDHEFVVSFYEARPPLLLGTPEEVAAQLQKVGAIQANCVARIVVTPGRMTDFVEVLQKNFSRFQKRGAPKDREG